MKWAVTRLCRPTGYGDYLWACRPMVFSHRPIFRPKIKILHEQNVIYFQFYIRLLNFRFIGSIIKKSLSRSIPLSILYLLFRETWGRKHGHNLSWSWLNPCLCLYYGSPSGDAYCDLKLPPNFELQNWSYSLRKEITLASSISVPQLYMMHESKNLHEYFDMNIQNKIFLLL